MVIFADFFFVRPAGKEGTLSPVYFSRVEGIDTIDSTSHPAKVPGPSKAASSTTTVEPRKMASLSPTSQAVLGARAGSSMCDSEAVARVGREVEQKEEANDGGLRVQGFDVYAVLDFEATCEDGKLDGGT